MNGMVIIGFLTYCLINELAISLQVVAVTIDTVIAMAILVVCINLYPIQDWLFLQLLWPPCYPCTNTLMFSFSESL